MRLTQHLSENSNLQANKGPSVLVRFMLFHTRNLNRGLGRGIAVAFAARGADVIVACRNPSQEIVDGITSEAKDSPLACN